MNRTGIDGIIIKKASVDPDFRRELMENPRQAILAATNLELREGVEDTNRV